MSVASACVGRWIRDTLLPYSLTDKLVVGIASRALFDLSEADLVYRTGGLAAYRDHQRARESEPLEPGTAYPLVRGLLALNERSSERLVEVIVISRNDADSGLRIFNSIEATGLDIIRGAFTAGRDPWLYLKAFQCTLFLSVGAEDVVNALEQGFPAALVLAPPGEERGAEPDELRIAFDGDAVLFDEESERIFQEQGIDAFHAHEARLADTPMSPGPFAPFLLALKRVQDRFPEEESPIRTALVTARGAPAHRRVVRTLRHWGVRIDETFFLGGVEKSEVLKVLRPHIFFDDQLTHLHGAQVATPSAHVIARREQLRLFGEDASLSAGSLTSLELAIPNERETRSAKPEAPRASQMPRPRPPPTDSRDNADQEPPALAETADGSRGTVRSS